MTNFNKSFALFILLGVLFRLSSCFEIIEEINMKNNGSGDVMLTINLSQSKSKVASIMLLDSVNGRKVPSEKDIKTKLNEAVAYLRKSEGISNVKSSLDLDNFIATVSFSFVNVSKINNITKNILAQQKIKTPNNSYYSYSTTNKIFVRKYEPISTAKTSFNKLKDKDREVFKTAKYVSIYRFESPVVKISNNGAVVAKSKKAIMLRANITELINGNINISNQIQLAK